MFLRLLVLFTVIPLAELFLLLKVGTVIGVLNTVALVIGTAVIGAWLVRRQGVATLYRIREQLAMGNLPADELMDGLMLIIAAVVLITPGLITDSFGFLLLVPVVRKWLKRKVGRVFERRINMRMYHSQPKHYSRDANDA